MPMQANSIVRALVAALALSFASPALAEMMAVGSGTIEFDPGEGLCALDPAIDDFDRLILEWQEQYNAGLSAVLGIYADCAKLELGRAGLGSGELGVYGILLAPLREGEIEQVFGQSRADILAEAVRLLGAGLDGGDEDPTDRINAAQDAFVGPEADDIAIPSVQQLGLLAVDEAAAYGGLLMKIEQADYSATVASVLGVTLVNGYVLNYNLYDVYVDETTLDVLLADVQAVMQRTAQLNPVGAFPVPQLEDRDDWRPIINVVIAGAVGAALVSLVRAVRRRRKE